MKKKYKKREKYIPKSRKQTRYIEEKKEPPKKEDVQKLIELWKKNIKNKKEK